jgi:hypothetical protein
MPETLKSWSFSRYNLYQQCPLKCKLIHIDKRKEPPSAAMERGIRIHELAEAYLKGELPEKPFPEELRLFRTEIQKLRKLYAKGKLLVEDSWAFTAGWDRTQWDNWADCWLRVKLDCAHKLADGVLCITDWKTGKFREDKNAEYIEQLELYALSAFLILPEIMQVRPRLVYLDEGTIFPDPSSRKQINRGWLRSDVTELKTKWEKRTAAMLADTTFAPRPNRFCGWCSFRKAAGGPCEF